MSTTDILQPLQQFLAQSQRLLDLARAGDWTEFEVLLQERQVAIPTLGESQLLIAVAKAGKADQMRELITEIQVVNTQIGEVAENGRGELAAELKQLLQAEKAMKAYQK